MAGTYSSAYDTFATAFLKDLGVADSGSNHAAVVAWVGGEAGWSGTNTAVTHNNPLNIKTSSFTSFGINPPGSNYITDAKTGKREAYGAFPTPEAGAAATAAYLQKAGYYTSALSALKQNNGIGFLDGIAQSPWSESHYGILSGRNKLLDNLSYVLGAKVIDATPVAAKIGGTGFNIQLTDLLGKKASDPLTADDITKIVDYTWAQIGNPPDPTGWIKNSLDSSIRGLLTPYIGKPINSINPSVLDQIGATVSGTGGAITGGVGQGLGDIANPIAGIAGALVQVVTYLLAVAIIIVGIWLYAKSNRQQIEVVPNA